MQEPHEATQAEIDAAIIACLRIFAARGRQLRLERQENKTDARHVGTPNGGGIGSRDVMDGTAKTLPLAAGEGETRTSVTTDGERSGRTEDHSRGEK